MRKAFTPSDDEDYMHQKKKQKKKGDSQAVIGLIWFAFMAYQPLKVI